MSTESDFVRATVFGNVLSGMIFRWPQLVANGQAYVLAAQHANVAAAYYEQTLEQPAQSHAPLQRYVPRSSVGRRPTVDEIKEEAEANKRAEEEALEDAAEAEEDGVDPQLAKFRHEMSRVGKRVV